MNEQQLLDMDDRERDAWIDEHIMGRVVHSGQTSYDPVTGGGQRLAEYSTDYNAMMRVVEKMREDGFTVIMTVPFTQEAEPKCRIIGDFFSGEDYPAYNKSLPLAVYLAAGRAQGAIDG